MEGKLLVASVRAIRSPVLQQTTCLDWEAKLCAAEGDGAAKKGKKKNAKLPFAQPKKPKAEEDDDFKPGKATAKARKASESKKPTAAVPSGSNVALKNGDNDDDDAVPPPPKKRAAPAKKAVTKIESDSDVEMVDAPPPKPAAKKAPVKAESDSEFETPPSSKDKGKGKAKNGSATKRKT